MTNLSIYFGMQQEYTSSEEAGTSETEKTLEKEKLKIEELTSRLSKLSVCNVNKQMCRDIKIEELQSQIKHRECDMKSQAKTINKLEAKLKTAHSYGHCLRQKLHCSDERNEATSNANEELNAELESLKCQFSMRFDELQQKFEALKGGGHAKKVFYFIGYY